MTSTQIISPKTNSMVPHSSSFHANTTSKKSIPSDNDTFPISFSAKNFPSALFSSTSQSVGTIISNSANIDENDITMNEATSTVSAFNSDFTPLDCEKTNPITSNLNGPPQSSTPMPNSSIIPVKVTKSFTHSAPFTFNNTVASSSSSFAHTSSLSGPFSKKASLRRSKMLYDLESVLSSNSSLPSVNSKTKQENSGLIIEDPIRFQTKPRISSIETGMLPKKRARSSDVMPECSSNPQAKSKDSPAANIPFFEKPFYSGKLPTRSIYSKQNNEMHLGLASSSEISPISSSSPFKDISPAPEPNSIFDNTSGLNVILSKQPKNSPQNGGPFKVRKTGFGNSVHCRDDTSALLELQTTEQNKQTPSLRPLPALPLSSNIKQTKFSAEPTSSTSLFSTVSGYKDNTANNRVQKKLSIPPFLSFKKTSNSKTSPQAPSHSTNSIRFTPVFTEDSETGNQDKDSSSIFSTISPTKNASKDRPKKLDGPFFSLQLTHEANPKNVCSPSKSKNRKTPKLYTGSAKSSDESFKFAKPLQTAFMSTGLLSKQNRQQQILQEERMANHPPDTPCKKPCISRINRLSFTRDKSKPSKTTKLFRYSSSTPDSKSSSPLPSNASNFKKSTLNTRNSSIFNSPEGSNTSFLKLSTPDLFGKKFESKNHELNHSSLREAKKDNLNFGLFLKENRVDETNDSCLLQFEPGTKDSTTQTHQDTNLSKIESILTSEDQDMSHSTSVYNSFEVDMDMDGTISPDVPKLVKSISSKNFNNNSSPSIPTNATKKKILANNCLNLKTFSSKPTDLCFNQNNSDVYQNSSTAIIYQTEHSAAFNASISDNSFSTDIADNDFNMSTDIESTPLSAYAKKKAIKNQIAATEVSPSVNSSSGISPSTNSKDLTESPNFDNDESDCKFLPRPRNTLEYSNQHQHFTPTKLGGSPNKCNTSGTKEPTYGDMLLNGIANHSDKNNNKSYSPLRSFSTSFHPSHNSKQKSIAHTVTPEKHIGTIFGAILTRSTTPVNDPNNGKHHTPRLLPKFMSTPLQNIKTFAQTKNCGTNVNCKFENNNSASNFGNVSTGNDETLSPHTPDTSMKDTDNLNNNQCFGSKIDAFNKDNSGGNAFLNSTGFRKFYMTNSSPSTNLALTIKSETTENTKYSKNINTPKTFKYESSPKTPANSAGPFVNPISGLESRFMFGGLPTGSYSNNHSLNDSDNNFGSSFVFPGPKQISMQTGLSTDLNDSKSIEANLTVNATTDDLASIKISDSTGGQLNTRNMNNASFGNTNNSTRLQSSCAGKYFAKYDSSSSFPKNIDLMIEKGLELGTSTAGTFQYTNVSMNHSNFPDDDSNNSFASKASVKSEAIQDESLQAKFGNVKLVGQGQFSYVYIVTEKLTRSNQTALDNTFAVKRTKKPYISASERLRILEEVDVLRTLTVDHKKRNKAQISTVSANNITNTTKSSTVSSTLEMETEAEGREYIVALITNWEHLGNLYIMTEYCENGNLEEFLAKSGNVSRLDEWRVWKILVEVSMGLRYIHESGYLHLDIKPANIFITFEGSLKIGDFGMATPYPVPEGTEREGDREYIAPEVLTKQIYGTSADIFSLGMMMLEVAANIVLPDNGIYWQKLRSGDLSDAGRLSSGSLYLSDDDMDDGGDTLSSDNQEDEENEFDNDLTYGISSAFQSSKFVETSGLLSPKFPPNSFSLPSGLAPAIPSRQTKNDCPDHFNFPSNNTQHKLDHFEMKLSSNSFSPLCPSSSYPNKSLLDSKMLPIKPYLAASSTKSAPHSQLRLIQQQIKQQERAKRVFRGGIRKHKKTNSITGGGGIDNHCYNHRNDTRSFVHKQQRQQQRINLSVLPSQSLLEIPVFSPIQNGFEMSRDSSSFFAARSSSTSKISSNSRPNNSRLSQLNKPPRWAPKFMIDNSRALDSIVQWMLSPDPELRPSAAELLMTDQVRWVEEHRKAGAVIYEGDYGPKPENHLEGMYEDVDFNWK